MDMEKEEWFSQAFCTVNLTWRSAIL